MSITGNAAALEPNDGTSAKQAVTNEPTIQVDHVIEQLGMSPLHHALIAGQLANEGMYFIACNSAIAAQLGVGSDAISGASSKARFVTV